MHKPIKKENITAYVKNRQSQTGGMLLLDKADRRFLSMLRNFLNTAKPFGF